MAVTGRFRPKKMQYTDDVSVEDFAEAWMEMLGRPEFGRAVKQIAEEDSVSLDVMMCRVVAEEYHRRGFPLPPKLRDYIAEHPDMPDGIRKALLKPDLH